jgi:hypothetical protein
VALPARSVRIITAANHLGLANGVGFTAIHTVFLVLSLR